MPAFCCIFLAVPQIFGQDTHPKYPISGTLVVCGGGRLPDSIRSEFHKAAGAERARIIVVPTASARADSDSTAFLDPWKDYPVASLKLLHTRSRQTADEPRFANAVKTATGVWFSGGQQSRITKAYRDTLLHRELKALLDRGGAVGGTSAGAAIMSPVMISGGKKAPVIEPGLGLLPATIVDQHFLKRNRFDRLIHAVQEHPSHLGIGIDEATAIVVRGAELRVLGDSYVTIYLSLKPKPRVEVLRDGNTVNLESLRALVPLEPRDDLPGTASFGSVRLGTKTTRVKSSQESNHENSLDEPPKTLGGFGSIGKLQP